MDAGGPASAPPAAAQSSETTAAAAGAADWAGLTPPLLQAILWLALDRHTLHFPGYLARGGSLEAQARLDAAALGQLAAVCRRWRAALAAAVAARATWAVAVQRAVAVDVQQLERLRVSSLDFRVLTWSEMGGGAACEALLGSPAFQQRSGASLAGVAGVPERLAPLLTAFPNLAAVGLAEDYESTGFGSAAGKSHLAPMNLAPLHPLPHLCRLTLELGVADLAAVAELATVAELALAEVDRVVLPPAPGASVADRLLAVAEGAGLACLTLEAASGCVVFEEANVVPLELELGHLARLLAKHSSRWSVQLGLHIDEAMQRRAPQMMLRRIAAGAASAPG